MSEALDPLTRRRDLRDLLALRLQQVVTPLWATLDPAKHLGGGERRKAISLSPNAESEYPSSRAVHFRLLHLCRSTGDTPKAVAKAKWFKSNQDRHLFDGPLSRDCEGESGRL
jgi:hypothetical protein